MKHGKRKTRLNFNIHPQVAFEGRWTRNTHPRNYPQDVWGTRFSNIIGASHRRRGSFWQEGDFASDGLKELARSGITKSLESELKENVSINQPHDTHSLYFETARFQADVDKVYISLFS